MKKAFATEKLIPEYAGIKKLRRTVMITPERMI